MKTPVPDNLWDDETPPLPERAGLYVAVSGNTSAGKSTLLNALRDRDNTGQLLTVSERLLHHPYLRLMFSAPTNFALPVQLNFMLQRHLILYRHLGLDHTVVIERSHLDDEMFVEEHVKKGYIKADELEAYRGIAAALHARLRPPDILVLLNPPPEVSLERLTRAEETGARPREFPNENAKRDWVYRWHAAYERLHEHFRTLVVEDSAYSHTAIVDLEPDASIADSVVRISEQMARKRS